MKPCTVEINECVSNEVSIEETFDWDVESIPKNGMISVKIKSKVRCTTGGTSPNDDPHADSLREQLNDLRIQMTFTTSK